MAYSFKTFEDAQDQDMVRALARQDSVNRQGLNIAEAFDRQSASAADEKIKQDTLENNAEYRRELSSTRKSRTDAEVADRESRVHDRQIAEQEKGRVRTRAEAVLADPNASPDDKRIANAVLMDLKPSISVTDAKPVTRIPVMRLNPRSGKVEQIGESDSNAHFVTEPAPPTGMNAPFAAGAGGGPSSLAQAIAEYRMAPPTGRALMSPQGQGIMAEVLKVNPAYRGEEFGSRQRMRTAFTSGPQGQTLNALNTAINHFDQFEQVAQSMGNGSFVPGNALYNWVRTQFGAKAPTNLEGIKTILAGELASAFKKTGATDVEIANVSKLLLTAASPEQLSGYVRDIGLPALASKAHTFGDQYKDLMKDTAWSPLTDTAKEILVRHGHNPDSARMGGTGAPPAPGGGSVSVVRDPATGKLVVKRG